MNFKFLSAVAAGTFAIASFSVANAQQAPMAPMAMNHANHGASASGTPSDALKKSMDGGMHDMQSMQTSGDVDVDFAKMMKIHHQQALEMAQVELDHGKSPEMKAMAKKIIDAQKKEIAQFDRWLAKRK